MRSFCPILTRIERLNLEVHWIIDDQREQKHQIHLCVDQNQPHYQGHARMKAKVTRTMNNEKIKLNASKDIRSNAAAASESGLLVNKLFL